MSCIVDMTNWRIILEFYRFHYGTVDLLSNLITLCLTLIYRILNRQPTDIYGQALPDALQLNLVTRSIMEHKSNVHTLMTINRYNRF